MGHNHSTPRYQQRTASSSLQNNSTDLPPTYAEVFENTSLTDNHHLATPNSQSNEIVRLTQELRSRDETIRNLKDEFFLERIRRRNRSSQPKTNGAGYEVKLDEKLLAVKDRERELLQTLNQVRSGKRYTESVMASLEQQVRSLKQEVRQKTKDAQSLEEELEESKKLVEDKASQIKILAARAFDAETSPGCKNCKDLEQQLQDIKAENNAEIEDLTTETSAQGCLIDFDNRYIETLYKRMRTCRIDSIRIPPDLEAEEKKTEWLNKAVEGFRNPFSEQRSHNKFKAIQEQQEITHMSTAAAIEYRRQIVTRHIQEAYTELRLARAEAECRIGDPLLRNDDCHADIQQEFDDVVRLSSECYKLGLQQASKAVTDEALSTMKPSDAIDVAAGGKEC